MQENNIEKDAPHKGTALTIGVVSDTHIPDRCLELHPSLLPELENAQIKAILHAGDIAVPRVLQLLDQVAPVIAVRGNRDWLFHRTLPWARQLEFAGVQLTLVHGHGTWINYLLDKWKNIRKGYNLQRYQQSMAEEAAGAKVIVFGHTHQPENVWYRGQLWFNPGSASIQAVERKCPTFGLLHFYENGEVEGEIMDLPGARLEHRHWIKDE